MAQSFEKGSATTLANRLNTVPIALFSLWLGPLFLFWGQALGPLRPFDVPPVPQSGLPWLAASLVGAAAVRLLPSGWYRVHRFEVSGRIYRLLGAQVFRRFVSNGDYVNRLVARRYPNHRVHVHSDRIAALRKAGLTNERSHLAAFVFGMVAVAFALLIDWTGWAVWLVVTNILCNLYPVLVQRLTRARLHRMAERRRLR